MDAPDFFTGRMYTGTCTLNSTEKFNLTYVKFFFSPQNNNLSCGTDISLTVCLERLNGSKYFFLLQMSEILATFSFNCHSVESAVRPPDP